jgi:hypothetical protein
MWQLHTTDEAQEWGLVDRFETIREAVRRIIELERTARNGLFLRTYVDLLCSDDESLRDLEYKGEKAAYVIGANARRACPVAPEMQYSGQQASFHIAAFLGNRLG